MRSRIVLLLELLIGVTPVTFFYVYTFPAGVSWTGRTLGLVLRGAPNAYTIVMAAIFVMGGIGLIALWAAIFRRLMGRGAPGRLLLAGILTGTAASISILAIDTMMGAYPLDYFLNGAPFVVAMHQVVSALRAGSHRRAAATAGSAA